MNIENWSSTPPTEPGLYPYTTPAGTACVASVAGPMGACVHDLSGEWVCTETVRKLKGHWGPRIDFQPYVPPKPPTIEAWVCEFNDKQRLMHKVDDNGFIVDRRGDWAYVGAANVRTREQWESMGYTNWQKLEVTTEWSNDQ